MTSRAVPGSIRRQVDTARIDAWQRPLTIGLLALYPALLLWAYRWFVAPTYDFMGYRYVTPESEWLVVVAVGLAWLPAAFLPARSDRPGTVIVWMLYLLAYVPSQVIPVVSLDQDPLTMLRLQLALLVGFAIVMAANALPVVALPGPRVSPRTFWAGFWSVYAAFTVLVVRYLGVPTTLPTFGEVYTIRHRFLDALVDMPVAVGYIWNWQGQVMNPFLLAYGSIRRSWGLVAVGVIGQVYLYGTSGAKSLLFSIALTAALVVLISLVRSGFGLLMVAGACMLVVGSLAADWLLDTTWFMALFVQRLIVTPGILTGFYYDFFLDHQKAMLGYSVLSPVFDYPYDATIPYIIGREYFHDPETLANANIWADGYANFGLPGIAFVSMIAGGVVWAFNVAAVRCGVVLTGIMAGAAALYLGSASVFTSMLTHGVALTILVLLAVPMLPESGRVVPEGGTRGG